MPWRSRLIASTRSSRSVVSVPCWVSTSRSSSSARRLTAPSRSRSRRSRSSLASTSATSGSAAPGSISASSATSAGSTSSISRISCATSARRRLAPSKRSSARAASSRAAPMRFERGARGAVGLGERVLGLRPAGRRRRGAPLRRSRSRRSARVRFSANSRGRIVEAGALGLGFLDARLRASRSARRRPRARSLQPCAVGGDRRRAGAPAISASRASACASARTSASCARWPSISPRTAASLRLDLGGRRQRGERVARPRRARRRPRRGSRSAAPSPRSSAESRAALRLASRSASAWRSRAASASCCSSRQRARAAVSASAADATSASAAVDRRAAWSRPRARTAVQLGLDIGEAVLAGEPARGAGRRIGGDREAVPAPEIAVARDQPLAGLEQRRRGAARRRARSTPICAQPARQLAAAP